MTKVNNNEDIKKCPECDDFYTGAGTLSRRDNETELCSRCGILAL